MKMKMTIRCVALLVTLAASAALATDEPVPTATDSQPAAFDGKARGVTVSCFRSGPGEWDAPVMAETIVDLKQMGANWISFHPYGRIANDGTVRYEADRYDSAVTQPLEYARQHGIKVMVIPHIAYWRSKFSWRGEITFEDEEAWQRFFDSYSEFIVHQAKLAQQGGAARFCIGIEYKLTHHREADWRKLIAQVREVYKGTLTYAANWDEYEDVRFWDAVDEIGVQFYFPLSQDENPTEAALHKGFDRVLDSLEAFSKKHDKQVLLTELGYPSLVSAAKEPWEDHRRRNSTDEGEALKLKCMRMALSRMEQKPFISGVFLWKWFPTDRVVDRGFALQYPQMRDLLSEMWKPADVVREDEG